MVVATDEDACGLRVRSGWMSELSAVQAGREDVRGEEGNDFVVEWSGFGGRCEIVGVDKDGGQGKGGELLEGECGFEVLRFGGWFWEEALFAKVGDNEGGAGARTHLDYTWRGILWNIEIVDVVVDAGRWC